MALSYNLQREENSKPFKTGILPEPIPVDALFDSTGLRPNPDCHAGIVLRDADLIFGVDVMSGHEFLMYGAKALRRVIKTGRNELANTVAIALDQSTDELERLYVLVKMIKGRCDYRCSA